MESPNIIRNTLAQYTGTEHHWLIFPNNDSFKITDGVKGMIELCDAFWLVTAILSWQCEKKVSKEVFQVWTLRLSDKENSDAAVLICDDGNNKELARQEIEFTDFPLSEGIKLYFDNGVLLLPSEY
jgi:hypothetical protein